MKALPICFLLVVVLSLQVNATCDLSSLFVDICVGNTCDISLLIQAANAICGIIGDTDYVLSPSGSFVVNIASAHASSYNSLTLGGNLYVNIQSALNIVGDFIVNAANTTTTIAQGVVVAVNGDLSVASQSTLSISGNVTVAGTATINGVLYLKGQLTQTTAQTAWIVSHSSAVAVSGSVNTAAWIQGNGGVDGDLSLSGNVTVSVGNSPGTVFINGNFAMSSTSTLQIDVDSSSNFDRLIISKEFNRNGILYANFEGGYIPSYGTNFVFASHASSSGSFSISHGDYDVTLDKVHPSYGNQDTSFEYNSGLHAVVPVVLIAGCLLALLI